MAMLLLLLILTGCKREAEEQAARRAAALCLPATDPGFDLGSLGFMFDAMRGQEYLAVDFFADDGIRPFFSSDAVLLKNQAHFGTAPKRLPEKVQVVWRKSLKPANIQWGHGHAYEDSGEFKKNYNPALPGVLDGWTPEREVAKRKAISKNTGIPHIGPWGSDFGDELLGDETLIVRDRLPQEVFDALCAGGKLSLKFRMSDQGVLMGWHVSRPRGKEKPKNDSGYSSVDNFLVGGDFREAEIFNGEAVRKGWYIDRKTKQKIEIDF